MLVSLVHESAHEPLPAVMSLVAGCGAIGYVVFVNEVLDRVDVAGVSKVVILQENAKVVLKRVCMANVVIDSINRVVDGGTVQGVHAVKIVGGLMDVGMVLGRAVATQWSGESDVGTFDACDNVL